MFSKSIQIGLVVGMAMGVVACSAAVPDEPDPGESIEQNEGEAKLFCGGIAAFPCPTGYVCVDDPTDNCDPKNGGADCGGYCRRQGKPSKCNYGDPNKSWVSKDATQCMVIKFMCAEGQTPFFNECGCGCETAPTPCGSAVCGAGQVCCNASCGICTDPGGFCTQQVCEPAPL